MARRRRIHIPNAFVHISHRCNHGDFLFENPKVKDLFLAVLEEVASYYGYQVVYFCVQDNHIHLFLFTPPEIENHTIASFMHRLDSNFGHRLNALQCWQGVTWQGRYNATGWFPQQRLWMLEMMLWYASTNTARRTLKPVPAALWPWGALYWLLRGETGPVRTTLQHWLNKIYGPRGCADPVAEFARFARQTDRPDWHRRILELERQGLPWLGPPGETRPPPQKADLQAVLDTIHSLNLRSWKQEVERYSLLMQPMVQPTDGR